jgi:hypothetical protein
VRQCRNVTAAISLVAVAVVAYLVTAGADVVGATRPARRGLTHARLVGRFAPNGASGPVPGLGSSGSEVIAAFVATLAVLSLAYLIVTFVRRKTTSAA